VPGHASFPSGHSTQAHLIALCINDIFDTLPQQGAVLEDAWTLADRIARNREIAGGHYESDTNAGKAIALAVLPTVQNATELENCALEAVRARAAAAEFEYLSTLIEERVREAGPAWLREAAPLQHIDNYLRSGLAFVYLQVNLTPVTA